MAINRRDERELVFVMLFQASFHKDEEQNKLYEIFMEDLSEDERYEDILASEYIKNTFLGTLSHEEEFRERIQENSKTRNVNRISRVSLSVLFLALYEMFYNDDIPEAIAINEAVELVKKYDDKKAATFVNGILGNISKTK